MLDDDVELSDQQWAAMRERVAAFRTNWSPESLVKPAPSPDGIESVAEIVALIRADIELGFEHNKTPRTEDYLQQFPELAERSALGVGILCHEVRVACRHADPSYRRRLVFEANQRFPQWEADLTQRLSELDETSIEVRSHQTRQFDVGDRIGSYQLTELIGQGGMGTVLKAFDTVLQRVVAMKVLRHDQYSDEAAQRFRSEAESLAQLSTPGIVRVFEVGEHDNVLFIVLEYIGGGTLKDRLNGTPIPHLAAAEFVCRVARAMQDAHEQKVVHRDLKPSNILLRRSDVERFEDLEPIVTDFGLARRLDVNLSATIPGHLVGTPQCMAPEQTTGVRDAIGVQTDVYALGIVLYELLTGRVPFEAATVLDTIQLIRTSEPVSPRALAGSVPRDLETICLKCLSGSPARRYRNAGELANELDRFQEGRPILARPIGTAARCWRLIRRRPVTSALACLLLLSMIAGTAASLHFASKRDEAANRAEDKLYESLVAQSRATCDNGRPGQQATTLATVREASKIHYSKELQNLGLAAMVSFDLEPVGECTIKPDVGAIMLDRAFDRFAAVENDGAVVVRSLTTGESLRRFPRRSLPAHSLKFDPSGRYLVVSYYDRQRADDVLVFDLIADGTEPIASLPGTAASFSPDGQSIVVAGSMQNLTRYSFPRMEQLTSVPCAATSLRQIRVSSDGTETAVVRSDDSNLLLQSFNGGTRTIEHPDRVLGAAWHPDSYVAAACADGHCYVYDTTIEKPRLVCELIGHALEIGQVQFSSRGDVLATGSWDGTTQFWDWRTGRSLLRISGKLRIWRGDQVGIRRQSSVVTLKVCPRDAQVVVSPVRLGQTRVAIDCHPDEPILAACAREAVVFYDANTGDELGQWSVTSPTSVMFAPGSSAIWAAANGEILKAQFKANDRGITLTPPRRIGKEDERYAVLTLSPNGSLVAMRTRERICVFDAESGDELCSTPDQWRYTELMFDASSQYLITSGWQWQGTHVRDARTLRSLYQHHAEGNKVSAFVCGTTFVSTIPGVSDTIELGTWNVLNTRKTSARPSQPGQGVAGLAFGKIAIVSDDETISLLDDSGRGVAELTVRGLGLVRHLRVGNRGRTLIASNDRGLITCLRLDAFKQYVTKLRGE